MQSINKPLYSRTDIFKKILTVNEHMNQEVKYTFGRVLKDYWIFLKGKRFEFVFFTILRALSGLGPFIIAYLLGKIIDFFTNYAAGDSISSFYFMVGGIFITGTLQIWLRFFAKKRMQTIAANIRKEVRVKAMSKLIDLSLKWHEQEETGSKIQKINSGGESIFRGIKDFSNDGILILTNLIASLTLFLFMDWRYAIFGIVYVLIYLSGEYYFNKKLILRRDELNKIKEKVSGKIHESASNLLTVKSLGLKDKFRISATSYEKRYFDVWVKMRDASQKKLKTIKIFSVFVYASFILLLGLDVVKGTITLGSIVIFSSYFSKLREASEKITHNANDFIAVKSSIGRFMTIFGVETFSNEKGLANIPSNWKKIEFQNVDFNYKDSNTLKDFNLTINRNEKVGIVGKSGCGKSTLVKLLLRLYEPKRGVIKINSKELKSYKHSSITNNFSIVLQDSEMFNLSLLENITISTTRKNIKMFKKAVNVSQLNPVIKELPQGLNTLIGERGYQLSGGERQRVGIARAIYKDPSLLILDEATSSLDSKTERLIQEEVDKLKDKTLLIVAHRISTLRNVDRIIVMDKGRIVEEGTFNQLLNKKGKFFQLYKLQHQ